MNLFRDLLQRIARAGINVAAILIVLTMLAIVGNAVLRYVFGGGIHLVIEISGFIFLWLIFLGLAGTYIAGGHVTVELLTDALPPRIRRFLARFVVPPVAIVYVAMIGWASVETTQRLFNTGETSIGTVQFKLWVMLIVMPLGCVLLLAALLHSLLGLDRSSNGD